MKICVWYTYIIIIFLNSLQFNRKINVNITQNVRRIVAELAFPITDLSSFKTRAGYSCNLHGGRVVSDNIMLRRRRISTWNVDDVEGAGRHQRCAI